MKNFSKIIFISNLIASVFFISSCQKTSSDSTQTGMNNACINNPSACQQGVYQQGNGFYPYNYNNGAYNNGYPYNYQGGFYYTNNSAYLCSCPVGTMPTYNNYGGLGCVQSNYISGGAYAYYGWNGSGLSGASNNQWTNIPQVSNYTGYNNQSNCYNGVVQSCMVDQASTCTTGYTCRSTSAQSRVGLCVSNTATNTGGTQYGGGYR